jgi:hypothetical protein
MDVTQFYFLSDQYYIDFPDPKLMKNKEAVAGKLRSRPCFFVFPDKRTPGIYWLVPISSQVEKYNAIAQQKIQRYGRCNTIRFGTVLGREAAFLIQNMCPVIDSYLTPYIDKNKQPIRIDDRTAADITKNAQEVLGIARRGSKVIFPDVHAIYCSLQRQLQREAPIPAYTAAKQLSIQQSISGAQIEANRRNSERENASQVNSSREHEIDES